MLASGCWLAGPRAWSSEGKGTQLECSRVHPRDTYLLVVISKEVVLPLKLKYKPDQGQNPPLHLSMSSHMIVPHT